MDLFSVIIRTLFFYFFVSLSYRIMGKREVGQLGITDLIVSILIAEMVAISIENTNDPMYLTIIPIGILVFLEVLLAYISTKSNKFRFLLEGKPALIIKDGNINFHEMIKQRYTLDDMLVALRQKGIKNLKDVEYAFLETNGKLSIFKYELFNKKGNYPMPLVIDGEIQIETLKYIKKSKIWLNYQLKEKQIKLNEIFYAFYKNKKIYIIKKGSN